MKLPYKTFSNLFNQFAGRKEKKVEIQRARDRERENIERAREKEREREEIHRQIDRQRERENEKG